MTTFKKNIYDGLLTSHDTVRQVVHDQFGLGHWQTAVVAGAKALVCAIAVYAGLTVPDVAVRVARAVAIRVGLQDVHVGRLDVPQRQHS